MARSVLRFLSPSFALPILCFALSSNVAAQEAPQSEAAAIATAQSMGISPQAIEQYKEQYKSGALKAAPGQKAAKGPAVSQVPKTGEVKDKGAKAADGIAGFSSNLSVFGANLFAPGGAHYVSPTDLPVPADYVVGVGDVVEVRLFGKENKVLRLEVERSGNITLPEIGAVSVAGLTLENMGKMLLERIAKQKIGVEATISMGPMRSIQIFLMGDVNQPGAITTDALTTVSNALMIGGGIKTSGSMRRVEVRRRGTVVSRIDLYDSLLKGSDLGELRLQSGDTVFVPRVGKRVGVDGEVLRSAIFEVLHEKTIDDLITLAGGFRATAYPQDSKIDRVGKDWQRNKFPIPLASLSQRQVAFQDGDIIEIPGVVQTQRPSKLDARFKTIAITGNVRLPGTYAWVEGMHLGQLLGNTDQLTLETYRPFAVVQSVEPKTGARKLRTVNLIDVITHGKEEPIQRDDEIFVFSHSDIDYLSSTEAKNILASEGGLQVVNAATANLEDSESKNASKNVGRPDIFSANPALLSFVLDNSISLRGEIARPGLIPVPANFSVETAITARGGFTREADLKGIEVGQLVVDSKGRTSVQRKLVDSENGLATLILKPGETVQVRKRSTDVEKGLVKVRGEVLYPGAYEIRKGEKLSELLSRAGGVTSHAYPFGSVFLRDRIKQEKKEYYLKASVELQNAMILAATRVRSGSTSGSDSGASAMVAGMVQQMRNTEPVGRIVVEADPAVLLVRPELDVVLEAGDELFVPRRPSSILVMGEVLNPGAVQFISGKGPKDYIAAVGGVTKLADEDRVFAILPNGSAESLKLSSWNFQSKLLPPGSVIYVSREPLPSTSMDLWLIALSVFKDLALAAASLAVIGN